MASSSTSLPAPVGGLNSRDGLSEMKPSDCIISDNWWPYPSYMAIRKGSTPHVTGFPSAVETLVEYLPTSGASKLFAASGAGIYDVTIAGAVGAPVQTGLTNVRFQDAGITTPGGSFLYLVNGQDDPRLWDGTTWKSINGASTPAITGVTTNLLVHVCLFKNRLYFTERNSLRVWFLPVNSIGGAASMVDLGSVFRNGGSIQAVYTWTIDAGAGADDHIVAITTNGEVAVYQGTDPTSASTFSLVGVFTIGEPLGRRCGVKYGGDLLINCKEGVYPLSKGLLSATVDRSATITDKIQPSITESVSFYGNNFGWQLCVYPAENMIILNVPQGSGMSFQYAQNTITGAWTKFKDWNANCWLRASTGLYYGGANSIVKAWVGNSDNSVPITADLLPAFNYFGSRSLNKYFTMVRPYFQSGGTPSILYNLNVDFFPVEATGSLSYTPPTGMVWGSMVWGSMVWGNSLNPITGWNTVGAVANAGSLRIKVQNNGAEFRYTQCDFLYGKGGLL